MEMCTNSKAKTKLYHLQPDRVRKLQHSVTVSIIKSYYTIVKIHNIKQAEMKRNEKYHM